MITVDDLKQALPVHLKGAATQDLADKVNTIAVDPEFARTIRENIIGYTGVLKEGKFKIEDYLNAVAYVSYKLMKYTNQESYKRTFPQRYAILVANGADEKTISAYVAAYNKGKLVNLILEQTLVPSWVLNQEAYQEAINTQMLLMTTSKSDMVRTQAANSLLTHLKRPEKHQVELSIGAVETSGMKELKDALTMLAEQQQTMISQGTNTRQIAHQKFGGPVASDLVLDAEVVKDPAPVQASAPIPVPVVAPVVPAEPEVSAPRVSIFATKTPVDEVDEAPAPEPVVPKAPWRDRLNLQAALHAHPFGEDEDDDQTMGDDTADVTS